MGDETSHVGPVFAVYQQGETMHLFGAMEPVEFRGISCVKGVALRASKEDWRAGLTIYLPTASVRRVVEYSSIEQYRRILSDHYTKKAEM